MYVSVDIADIHGKYRQCDTRLAYSVIMGEGSSIEDEMSTPSVTKGSLSYANGISASILTIYF